MGFYFLSMFRAFSLSGTVLGSLELYGLMATSTHNIELNDS